MRDGIRSLKNRPRVRKRLTTHILILTLQNYVEILFWYALIYRIGSSWTNFSHSAEISHLRLVLKCREPWASDGLIYSSIGYTLDAGGVEG